jgi:hypothetical protein|tara:strand:- start:100 stop:1263 length:1164 start_codon:yes stop_codon:yes gene_type:complete
MMMYIEKGFNMTAELKINNTNSKMKLNEHEETTLEQWIDLPDHPLQRNHKERDLGHLKRLLPDHLELAAAKLTKDITDPDTGKVYKKGEVYKVDGHGRSYIWENKFSDLQPDHVSVTFFEVSTWEEFEGLYDRQDSSTATEKGKEKFVARLKKHGVVITDNKLKLVQPIGYAVKLLDSNKHTKASGLSTHQLNLAVSEFHEEYKVLEEHVCSGSTKLHKKSKSNKFDWSPIITAAALIALKSFKVTSELLEAKDLDDPQYIEAHHDNAVKLVELFKTINKGGKDTMTEPWNPVTHIVNEFDTNCVVLKSDQYGYPALNEGNAQISVSFVLYWILQHMKESKNTPTNLPNKKGAWSKMASNFPEIVRNKFMPLYHENVLPISLTNIAS